ncbi:ABC-2 type transport system ATP-binding protein [Halovenus aranensis]|uniref:ABC-2 type transport system ATP-binding protein n=1 Tax=Halovenus aranensis TaxID=890420 RepID=A0A1G8VAA1_9EURY|nr:ABC transporter ATP-binding protein [Halovenus aranensis]SDJ62295.1 ABC-2 type transport system ATP-binding protein [Halovenus aranensis]
MYPPQGDGAGRSEAAGEAAIAASGLSKRYGETLAVSDLDLTIPQGSVYGFLGPNGAGKTTTIEMLTSLLPPTSGDASVMGVPVSERDRVKQHLGYLPHEPPVYESYTAREQLAYAADIRNLDISTSDDRIDTLLDRIDLLDVADERIGTYSQGMRRKVGLVQALLHDPDVAFLDEPTSGLDPRASRTVIDLITEQVTTGTTVFLSSHILPVVEELADTVGVLYEGELVAEDTPTALIERTESETGQGTLEAAFLDITTDERAL